MAASVSLDLGKLVSITQTLENIFHQSFGPNALLTTVLTSTGKVMVTSNGACILTSLQLDHPVARMVCSSALAHHCFTGDGTKTFIFMVAEALRSTLRRAKKVKNGCSGSEKPHINQFVIEVTQALGYIVSDILPNYVFPQLERYATATKLTGDMTETTHEMTLKVLQTSMLGKAPLEVSSHFSHLLSKFISSIGNSHNVLDKVLYLIDNFPTVTMEISNDNYSCSQIIPGVLLPKKSVTLIDSLLQTSNIKFILLECSLEGDQDEQTDLPPGVLQVSGYHGFQQALQWKEQTVRRILQHYANSGVQLIITSWAVSELVMSICRAVGMAAIGAIPLEDMERLAAAADVIMVHETHYVLSEENIATIKSLKDNIPTEWKQQH
ncbi:Bardet-Biedl syndrome 10 protein homolog [Lingula anatina]|uniref:Bardet-Biedl syndrome 10 protein homolog n=1 Tax=Lingula anatina TaxID=7574 RepID=A0A1S3I2M7_LINAN|nr:Bardet-Biedl syndrome 10 protein homolog [Lingula anatina]|eukprot:XP_013392525.1 Bardet-Biedl syndrome 10 protein homolog [Lingula anatina]